MDLLYKNEKKLFVIAAIISSLFWTVLILGTVGIALVYLLLMYVLFLFTHSGFISYLKGTGVKITSEQYPDLYARLQENCKKIGLEKVPDAYVLRTDFFNALATRFLGRNFVVLFSDVLDSLEENPGSVDFYIGHELGHIHRKHLTWGWFIAPACVFPLLGAALRRAEEYTCDRYGAVCCQTEADIKFAIAAIAAGDSRYKTINVDAYIKQIADTRGFWMSLNELTSDYPWLTKRMASALAAKNNTPIKHPRRSFFAWLLALFIPRLGVAGGGGAVGIILVIAIIGILASVAVPQYQAYIEKTRLTSAYNMSMQLQEPVADYAVANQAWPATLADLGFDESQFSDGANNFSVNLYENGLIAANVGQNTNGENQYIVIEPNIVDGVIQWSCAGQKIDTRHLPSECR